MRERNKKKGKDLKINHDNRKKKIIIKLLTFFLLI